MGVIAIDKPFLLVDILSVSVLVAKILALGILIISVLATSIPNLDKAFLSNIFPAIFVFLLTKIRT